nr:hypothetical protein [Tanacetum cinerariifolium]
MTSLTSMCELACQIVQKKLEEKKLEEDQAAKAQNWKLPVCYDDDDVEESSNSLEDNIISELPSCVAITPNEPVDSLSIDSLFDEFAGELTLLKSIPPRIDETDCHLEKETHFAKRLLYDNSSPRPPEEIKVYIPNLTNTRVSNQEKSPDLLSHLGLEAFQPSAECSMIINRKNTPLLDVLIFHFYPLDQTKYGGIRSSLAT